MSFGLTARLITAFGLITLVVVLGSAALNRLAFERDFASYLHDRDMEQVSLIADLLAEEYRRDAWQEITFSRRGWVRFLRDNLAPLRRHPMQPATSGSSERFPPGDPKPANRPAMVAGRRGPPGGQLPLLRRLALTDTEQNWLAGSQQALESSIMVPVTVGTDAVGYLHIAPAMIQATPEDARFIARQTRSTALITALAMIVAALGAIVVARNLRKPIQALTDGAEQMTEGNFDARIQADRRDELGELARRFNSLAATLANNRTARRQWVSDIAHELRTPITVLRGELQALQDGVRKTTPQAIDSLTEEADRLARLVDDLALLAASDEGSLRCVFEPLDLAALLRERQAHWQTRCDAAGHQLTMAIPSESVAAEADRQRLHQLLDNLIENSCRYTDSPGRIEVALVADDKHSMITVDDSSPAVPANQHDRIFDRLARLDASRTSSGAGLGLSICRAVADAHGGDVVAKNSALGGLQIRLTLPFRNDA